MKETDPGASSQARAMCDLIDKAIDEVRGMAIRLRPAALDKLGIVDALDWYVRDFEKRTKVACVYRHSDVPKLDDKTATAAYRIAQESLTNVARHSGASRVDICLRAEQGVLALSVEDDGKGFDLRGTAEFRGIGVVGMRERAALVGGTLAIRSRPGGGTRVDLKIPIEGAAEVRA